MQRAQTIFLGLAVTVIICWLLTVLKFVFLPLVLALFFSFLLNPLVNWMTKYKIPRVLAVSFAIILALAVLFLVGNTVLNSLVAFSDEFPKYENQIREMVQKAERISRLNIGPITQERIMDELNRLSLSSLVGSTLNSFFSFLLYLLFTLVFVIYFLLGMAKLPDKIRRAFPPEQAKTITKAVQNITIQVQQYILAKTVTSVITGGMMLLVCLVFRVDFPITWAFFTFLANFIPTIGVFVASIPPPLVALIKFGSWSMALWVAVALIVIMMTLGNIIEPRILGDSVNLSPMVALFALIFWGWLWGPAGMLVAVPVTAMLKFTCDHIDGLRPIGVLMGGES